ncbi:hypothetical protein ACFU6R_03125 [Streptomyces sp. NPDC057499]|uniref:hypothetical protein n=1 Tax=Streptomyces sp. NPDC057499 TaxID=3346150 RepID=UPI0036CE8C38
MTAVLTDRITETLTDENVQDIIDTASEGGITYWAIEPTAEEFAGLPGGKTYTIVEGEDARWLGGDREVEEVHYVSRDQVRWAYARLLDLEQTYVNREYHGYIVQSWIDRTDRDGIDTCMIDAGAADVLVQVAIFNEVRYG